MKKFLFRHSDKLMVFLSYILIFFTFQLLLSYYMKIKTLDANYDHAFSKNAERLRIYSDSEFDFSDIDNVGIYKINENMPFSAYEIIKPNGRLYIADRLIIDADFMSADHAIVGSEVKTIIDTSHLVINGKEYKVIKEFHDNDIPSNNFAVFYKGDICTSVDNSVFIIDGKRKKDIAEAVETVKVRAEQNGAEAERISNDFVTVSDFISYKESFIIIFILISVTILFTMILINYFEYTALKKVYAVYLLLGYNKCAKMIYPILFLPIGIGFVICFIINAVTKNSYALLSDLITLAVMALINIETAEIYKRKLNNMQTVTELNNE